MGDCRYLAYFDPETYTETMHDPFECCEELARYRERQTRMSGAKELVIGLGFIGTRLREMTNAEGATRGNPIYHHHHVIDLLSVKPDTLPTADLVYITAGINGQASCEGNAQSWLTNCDGTISIAKEYTRRGSWVVWLSSSTVEWASSAYARQKAFTESVLLNMDCSIIRPGRVTQDNLEDLCTTIINAGRNRWPGITRWGMETPYVR